MNMKKIFLVLLLTLFLGVLGTGNVFAACSTNQVDTGCGGSGGGQTCGPTYRGCLDNSTGQFNCVPDSSCSTQNGGTNNQTGTTTTQSAGTGAITCDGGNGVDTAIGCIPINNQNALIGFFLRWGIGIGGGIAFLLIIVAGFQIITSRGDPNRLKAGQELMTSAIAGLLLLIFSIVILRIIGFDILNIAAFK